MYLERLEEYGRDYFVIFAHVDQNSGLFKECSGGLLESLSGIAPFKKRVLGLQKAHSRDSLAQFERLFGYIPALVEGSDPKSISEIGKGTHEVYLKIGEFSYSAIKFALQDHKNRVFNAPIEIKHGILNLFLSRWQGFGRANHKIFSRAQYTYWSTWKW